MNIDRIPVRLTGGRVAWVEIPIPFYADDKQRLIDQINFVMTDEPPDLARNGGGNG